MYQLKEQHIDFILNDISARGVTIEDLQYNLLDHICCIIENNLEENGDFENFYHKTVQTFFKKDMKEIEEETISLIIFKNYYTMKKVMIVSGTISAALLSMGLILKFMHWPGAAFGIILGIGILSFVFLPLMFILKMKEKQQVKDKLTIGIGAFAGILISLGILFKVMHWPFANVMMNSSMAILLLLFLPFYFFSGIRNPDTKVNTIVSSILFISAAGLLFTLLRSPRASFLIDEQLTKNYMNDELLLQSERAAIKGSYDSANIDQFKKGEELFSLCEDIKNKIIEIESENIRSVYEEGAMMYVRLESNTKENEPGRIINDHTIQAGFKNEVYIEQSTKLGILVTNYNALIKPGKHITIQFDLTQPSKEANSMSCFVMLDQLIQVQRTVLQNQRALIACK